MPTEDRSIKVFISYSHDTAAHQDRILALADRLRDEGIDCNLDQYEPAPAEGWPRWMEREFRDADFILVVCTETYRRRFEGREERGKGLGVKWEGAIITQELYQNETINARFIPVVFAAEDLAHIPDQLSHYTHYRLDDAGSYETLYRRLTNQPKVIKRPIGKLRSLEPINRRQDFDSIQSESVPRARARPTIVVPEPASASRDLSVDLGGNVKLDMIYVAGGEFLMGSNEHDNEKPIHRVKLSPYFISKYPVTQAQWKAVMKNNPSHFKGEALPVERVSWDDAMKFCETVSARTGKIFRLPTEAEWEMACRAGSTGRYCFGDDEKLLGEYAWYRENAEGKTHPVGQKKPNAWGLFDMHGNVWEWCADWYSHSYYAECERQGVVTNPQGASTGSNRVARGGGWGNSAVFCRSANRSLDAPGYCFFGLGFRLVRVGP